MMKFHLEMAWRTGLAMVASLGIFVIAWAIIRKEICAGFLSGYVYGRIQYWLTKDVHPQSNPPIQ